jgi:hypothetical protein
MIAYKVLKRNGNALYSSAHIFLGRFGKHYKRNVNNRAKAGTKLFVFDRLASAIGFAGSSNRHEIWEVEVPSLTSTQWCARMEELDINNFWVKNDLKQMLAPLGTCFTDSVRLVKKVI